LDAILKPTVDEEPVRPDQSQAKIPSEIRAGDFTAKEHSFDEEALRGRKESLRALLQGRIDGKTKPPGSLGKLEELALRIGLIQNTESPFLNRPTIAVFAADHGASKHPISAFPAEVTRQMVLNFLSGGAAINVLARQSGMELCVCDCGVAGPPIDHPNLIQSRVAEGTADYVTHDAMSEEQLQICERYATDLVNRLEVRGTNVLGFGEMGIGNTSSASLIMHCLTGIPLEQCVGAGTGLNESGIHAKLAVLTKATRRRPDISTAREAMKAFGGFEIAQMSAAMKEAHKRGMILLIDGFISSTAFLAARAELPEIQSSAIFCHQSREKGHSALLQQLGADPVLDLGLRLGEGTGCALAYPLLRSAVAFLNEMASFKSAGVSGSS
tara:strand:+ start:11495 stop:12646 length:1152 start_codon:yes stop_codon:yes gene_type:complete